MRVLIDGENLRHQVAHILYTNNKIKEKNGYFPFHLVAFLEEVLGDKALEPVYYTTRIKQPNMPVPIRLQKHITTIGEANRRWVADLTNQKVKVVKAGHLRIRESSACIHCHKKTLVLQEKGVDVRVATDLVQTTSKEGYITLASSDSDLTPAMQAAKANGIRITYLCYAGWLNRSVSAQAHKTVTFDDADVVRHFPGKQE